jgi:hypothetical protein
MTPPLGAVPDRPEQVYDSAARSANLSSHKPVMGGSPSPLAQRRVLATQRQATALALRGHGMTFAAIAKELGYGGPKAAAQAVEAALKGTMERTRAQYLAEVNSRLDSWLLAMSERLQRGEPRAVEVGIQIEARRASMLGLDAPKKIEISDSQLEEERERLRTEVTVLRQIGPGTEAGDVVDGEIVEDPGTAPGPG